MRSVSDALWLYLKGLIRTLTMTACPESSPPTRCGQGWGWGTQGSLPPGPQHPKPPTRLEKHKDKAWGRMGLGFLLPQGLAIPSGESPAGQKAESSSFVNGDPSLLCLWDHTGSAHLETNKTKRVPGASLYLIGTEFLLHKNKWLLCREDREMTLERVHGVTQMSALGPPCPCVVITVIIQY